MFAVMMCSRAGTCDLIGDAWRPVYHVTTICGEDTRGAALVAAARYAPPPGSFNREGIILWVAPMESRFDRRTWPQSVLRRNPV